MAAEPIIAISSGEPAGIGPDIVAMIEPGRFAARLVAIGNLELLRQRAQSIGASMRFRRFDPNSSADDAMEVVDLPLGAAVSAGQLDAVNSEYVLELLTIACRGCLDGRFTAMVTAPVNKHIINQAGRVFSGHTEFLAELCGDASPVMLLHSGNLRVALVTTHLPLRAVAWEDKEGKGHLAYTDPATLKARYGITGKDALFAKMTGALKKFTDMATTKGALPKK